MSPLTYEDYAALPDDGHRYELIDGELVMTPAPGSAHQWVVIQLARLLLDHVERQGIGTVWISPIDVILEDSTILQPDIAYLAKDRERLMRKRGVDGAPTLVVEVLSPARPASDLERKSELYFSNGVPHFWSVDRDRRTIEGRVPGDGRYMAEAVFQGDGAARLRPFADLEIPLSKIWPPDFPD
jgi:Uma2 family endonuclease